MTEMGKRIRAIREQKGMTCTALAEQVGISAQGMWNLESGNNGRTLDKLPKIAKALGCRWVAEGIEHPEQLGALRKTGCDIVQGFVFYKPMLPEDFERVVFKGEKIVQQ